jgi:hypothetical protein
MTRKDFLPLSTALFSERQTQAALDVKMTCVHDKRKRSKRWLVVTLAPIFYAASVSAQPAHEDRWGWNFCPPPYPPACVGTVDADAEATKACAKDVERYIALVFAYRSCQARELSRAILEANRVTSAFKCRTERKSCDLLR